MPHYKDHPIDGIAVLGRGTLWRPRGLVFDPECPAREIKRLECADIVCTSSEEAQEYSITLCKAWIDGLKSQVNKKN